MTIVLDSANSSQVASAQVLDVFLGVPNTHVLIFTGIATPEWNSGDNLNDEQVIVRLGRKVASKPLPGQYSATVGLASIGDPGNEFTAATNDVDIDIDDVGELRLICDIAGQGGLTLHRFSYQANIIVQTNEPSISAQIVWKSATAAALAQFAGNLFSVEGDIQIPPAAGQIGGSFLKVADGTVVYPPVKTTDGFSVNYVILNPPLDTDIFVICNAVDGAFQAVGGLSGTFSCSQISGPRPVHLTLQNPQMPGVDFLLNFQGALR